MNKPKVILFDIGGVLIEYCNVFKTAATEQNIPQELLDSIFDKYDRDITIGKISPQELYTRCLDENNIEADRNYKFMLSWLKDFEVIEPTFDLITKLMDTYAVGFLSNIYKGMVPEMISQKKLPPVEKEFRFLSCDIGIHKPDQLLYDFTQEKLALGKDEILFVDDKDKNFPPAQALGWQVLEFPRKQPAEGVIRLKDLLL